MAPPSTLYRFRLSVIQTVPARTDPIAIDVRVAMHPSETQIFLVTRVLAYALNFQPGIEFTAGLADPDVPAIRVIGNHGEFLKWIEIGNPSPRRLHKAAKASASVLVYTYKNVEQLKRDALGETIYNAHKIQLFSLDPVFLEALAKKLERDNSWVIALHEQNLEVGMGDDMEETTIEKHELKTKR